MDADSHRQRPSLLIRAPRRFSRTEATRTRYPGSPAPPWPPPPPCAPVLPLTLFFSVSPWLCGEYSFGCGYALCTSVARFLFPLRVRNFGTPARDVAAWTFLSRLHGAVHLSEFWRQ